MKRFDAEYTVDGITYWPCYEAGKIGLIVCAVTGAAVVATSLWILLDNATIGTQLAAIVAIPVAIVPTWILCKLSRANMYTKVSISNDGILYTGRNSTVKKRIHWDDIAAVSFSREGWYGRKSIRLFLKQAASNTSPQNDVHDFVIPVCSVDEQRLLRMIPNHLWKNNPRHSW